VATKFYVGRAVSGGPESHAPLSELYDAINKGCELLKTHGIAAIVSIDDGANTVMTDMCNPVRTQPLAEPKMIYGGATAGWRLARSLRRVALSSCAVLGLAAIMVAARAAGPTPARAHFGVDLPSGFGTTEKVRWHHRHRHRYRYRRDNEEAPDAEIGSSPSGTPTSAPPSDSGRPVVRPSSAPSSRRPPPRGPDLEPSK
jgi:hypothetical protein